MEYARPWPSDVRCLRSRRRRLAKTSKAAIRARNEANGKRTNLVFNWPKFSLSSSIRHLLLQWQQLVALTFTLTLAAAFTPTLVSKSIVEQVADAAPASSLLAASALPQVEFNSSLSLSCLAVYCQPTSMLLPATDGWVKKEKKKKKKLLSSILS